jgi:hypothetical protein
VPKSSDIRGDPRLSNARSVRIRRVRISLIEPKTRSLPARRCPASQSGGRGFRKRGGFEGIGAATKALPANDFAIPQRDDLEEGLLDLDSAALSSASLVSYDQD